MTPKISPLNFILKKKTFKNYYNIVSALSPSIVRSLLLLIGFLLWLPPSQCFFAYLLAFHSPLPVLSTVFSSSQQFSEFPKLPRVQKNRRERRYGAMRSQEVRREALKRQEPQREFNQAVEEGGSHRRRNPISRRREPAKIGESPEGLSKSISRSFFGNIFLRYVFGVL